MSKIANVSDARMWGEGVMAKGVRARNAAMADRRQNALDLSEETALACTVFPSLTLQPIGQIRSVPRVKFEAGHQPIDGSDQINYVEIRSDGGYELALRDLAGFTRIWLVWWFHQNTTWRPLVMPPRGPSQRRGVFATRSPHRPNPIGMTPVRLLNVERLRLTVGPCDLVDGTPILDIKPYIPAYDSFPEESAGWIDVMETALRQPPKYAVTFSPLAEEQAAWLRENWKVDFTARLTELLARDPTPHRTRRIRRTVTGRMVIGCGSWQASFAIEGEAVCVLTLEPGYPWKRLLIEGYKMIADRDAQVAFYGRWPEQGRATETRRLGEESEQPSPPKL